MDTTTIRVSEPREMLAYLPHQLGFRPSHSAVAVSLRPPRGRVGLVARVDLPDLADIERGPQLARGLVSHLGADRASGAVLVLYTQDDPRDPGPTRTLARAAAEHFREAALTLLGEVVVWVVTSEGYLALDCDDRECCPRGGRPLRDLESTAVGAHMVLAGSSVANCREDLARIRPAPGNVRRSVSRVCVRWRARHDQAQADGADALRTWREQSVAAWRAAVAAELGNTAVGTPPVSASALGKIEAALADRRVRDGVLVALVPGTRDLAERSVRDDATAASAEMADAVGAIIDPRCAVEPPPVETAAHVRVLESVVAHGRRGAQPPALTLLALLAWWQGDGARARLLLERALAEDPEYTLAQLLDATLAAAVPPGWISRPQ
jgi:Domain of unknown function (DUF4192)